MYLSRVQRHTHVTLWDKTKSCIENHSRTAMCTSSLLWDVPTWEENFGDVEVVVLNFVVTADRSVNVVGHVSRLAAVFRVMTPIRIDKAAPYEPVCFHGTRSAV
jgi:hypothetical protein